MPCCNDGFENWHRKLDELSRLAWFVDELDGKDFNLKMRHKDVVGFMYGQTLPKTQTFIRQQTARILPT